MLRQALERALLLHGPAQKLRLHAVTLWTVVQWWALYVLSAAVVTLLLTALVCPSTATAVL